MSNPFVTTQGDSNSNRKALVASIPRVANAARWFWWIAALSLINTILMNLGSQTTFVIGLGFMIIADALFQAFKPAAFAIDVICIGFFYAMGFFALRGHRWAFIVGASVYALDALIYLYFKDFIPLAFHAWALFSIITGFLAFNTAIKSQSVISGQPNQALLPTPMSVTSPAGQEPRQP